MIPRTLTAAMTTLGIIYLGASCLFCALLSLKRKNGQDIRKAFARNGTAGLFIIVTGALLTLI